MLATDIQEQLKKAPYGGGFLARLQGAEKFVLDPHACAMAASVAMSRPSSVLDAAAFARLPFEPTWIEFANADVRKAMSDLGSPNIRHDDSGIVIERSGFLMRTDGESLDVEYAHRDRMPGGFTGTDIAPMRARFWTAGFTESQRGLMAAMSGRSHAERIAEGRVQKHIETIFSDPVEAAADTEMRSRLVAFRHPELAAFREGLARNIGEEKVAAIERGQAGELSRLFLLVALPALILLNCRNAVETERVAAPERLNAQRAKKGRPPLPEHLVVKMHLSPARRRAYEAAGGAAAASRGGGAVIGHFKVRKTGVYWWSPHWRGGRAETAQTRTFLVTR